jgi:DNA-binding MarR family transcriptional regulator
VDFLLITLDGLNRLIIIRIRILYQYPDKLGKQAMVQTKGASIGFALKKAQHSLRLSLDEGLRSLGLTVPQYAVLAALADMPGLSGAALARHCFVTPQTMTGIIANLETAVLVERAPDPGHGRIIKTQLTAKGATVLARAHAIVARIEERMVAELDRAEREALTDLLMQCADALSGTRTPAKA